MMLGLVCNPYHRGGITRWMVDFAVEWQRQRGACWFVAPRPRRQFINGAGRPTVLELMESHPAALRPRVVAPPVGDEYEFGMEAYRAGVYADAVLRVVPAGVPLLPTDDPATWRGASWVATRNPLVGVMHSDDEQYYKLARHFGSSLRAVACVSRRVLRKAASLPEVECLPMAMIPCGTPLGAVARSPGTAQGALRLIWVGRMVEDQKRVSDLPRIAALVRARGVEFELEIVGDGPMRDPVAEEFARLGLSDRVRLLGWRPTAEVSSRLADADVLLLPSNFEGMPVAVVEALSAGCAVVASRISGVEDYEHHPLADGCYWVHAVGDVDGAARLVIAAAQIPRAERAARARALAMEEFSIERCVQRYAELLAQVAPAPAVEPRSVAARWRLSRIVSYPVAAQRIARLMARGSYRRPMAPPGEAASVSFTAAS